jgi:acyl transferase domain-containing protein
LITMSFDAIAITGRGCVLPGALEPNTFWDNVLHGRVSLSAPPAGRWPVSDS